MTAPTIRFGVSYEDYAQIDAVNWSSLKVLDESAKAYRWALDNPRAQTDTLTLGSVTHTAILEPHRLAQDVAVWDGGTRRGKVYDAWKAEHAGKHQIRAQDFAPVMDMQAAVRTNAQAMRYLRRGKAEVVIEWTDRRSGIRCKARLDWLPDDPLSAVVDVKTARTVDERLFASQVARLMYYGQMAHYRRGLLAITGHKPTDAVIIAVENSAPHDVGVFLLDDEAIWAGDQLIDELLARLAECRATNHWPGRYAEEQILALPSWAIDDDDLIQVSEEGA